MKRDDSVYLQHILEAIIQIEVYLAQTDEIDIHDNNLIRDALIRQLAVIGEAIKNITLETRNKQPHIPWKSIAGMRDILVHQYFGIDTNIIWNTSVQDLPQLKKAVLVLLEK